jgi:phosphotransacetylase
VGTVRSPSKAPSIAASLRPVEPSHLRRIIFPDGECETVIRAVHILRDEQLAAPVLVGDPQVIQSRALELGARIEGCEILNPATHSQRELLTKRYYEKRNRKGVTWADASYYVTRPDWFSAMLDAGEVDGMVAGLSQAMRMSCMRCPGPLREGVRRVSGLYLVLTKDDVLFFADATRLIRPARTWRDAITAPYGTSISSRASRCSRSAISASVRPRTRSATPWNWCVSVIERCASTARCATQH